MKKIGGEFEFVEYGKAEKENLYYYLSNKFKNIQYYFSGRSAIYTLLKELVEDRKIKTIYLPAYCCESVYYPVKRAFECSKIKINFYKQNNNFQSEIENVTNNSIIYIIDYFGKIDELLTKAISEMKKHFSNIILIEDITHSLFLKDYNPNIDYHIYSLRKWLFIPDGAFISSNHHEIREPSKIPDKNYINSRLSASLLKNLNLSYDSSTFKDLYYLNIYKFCEKEINNYLDDIKISDYSLNIIKKVNYSSIIRKRVENKEYLTNNLAEFSKFFSIINTDTGIFTLPIFFKNKNFRDILKRELSKMNIFLPIHWPIEWQKTINNDIYYHNKHIADKLLSFPIDQRYGIQEMKYVIQSVSKIINTKGFK